MPKLLEEKQISLDWSDITSRVKHKKQHDSNHRAPGVHLSGILRAVLIATGVLTPIDDEQMEEFPLRMALGMAWEDWAVGLWPDMTWQPGEVYESGVAMNPDGLTRTRKIEQLEEFKATWCSRRTYGKDVTQHKYWMWQLAGYLHAMQMTRARLHVLWVCGDYKQGPPSPMYVTYLVEFTKAELLKFWKKVVLTNKDIATPE